MHINNYFIFFYFIFKLYNIVLVLPNIEIITLNVNGLNVPTKRHRLAEWIQKQDPYICCLQEAHFRPKIPIDWKWEDGKIYSMQMGSKSKLE